MMRYLTLAAHYTGSALRDDFVGTVVPEEIGLSDELADRIRDWNGRYRTVIPLDDSQRKSSPTSELIEALDEEGLQLVTSILTELADVKLRYFSEGHLRFVA